MSLEAAEKKTQRHSDEDHVKTETEVGAVIQAKECWQLPKAGIQNDSLLQHGPADFSFGLLVSKSMKIHFFHSEVCHTASLCQFVMAARGSYYKKVESVLF